MERFPVIDTDLTIPWSVALKSCEAWADAQWDRGYLVPMSVEHRVSMGGFTEAWLDEWAPGWREDAR